MKMKGTCICIGKRWECPELRRPMFHSGYTGKSGVETWWHCNKFKKPIRHIKECNRKRTK